MADSELAGLRVCIVRRAFLEHDKRSQQMARLLTENGAVVRIIALSDALSLDWADRPYEVVEVKMLPASVNRFRMVRVASNLIRNQLRRVRMDAAIVRAAKEFSPDVVHCMSLFSLPLGFRVGEGVRVVYDSREHFVAMGAASPIAAARRRSRERRLIARVDNVLTVSDPIADDLATRYAIARPVVVYNGPTECVNEVSPNHTPLRVLHLGKLYLDRNLMEVVDAVVSLQGRVVLTLQGWGEDECAIRNAIRVRGLESTVRILPPCPPEEVVESAMGHDVGVINFKPDNDNFKWSAPNKLFEYMGAGLAVMSSNLPYIQQLVKSAECGVTYDPDDPEALPATLRYLVENPSLVEGMKAKAVIAAREYLWDSQADKLYAVYRRFVNRDQ